MQKLDSGVRQENCPCGVAKDMALALKSVYDAVAEMQPYEDEVFIWKSIHCPMLEGQMQKISKSFWDYVDEFIFPYDSDLYIAHFGPEQVKDFLESGQEEDKLRVRMRQQPLGSRWYEIHMIRIGMESNRVLLLMRDIQNEQTQRIVYNAAYSDYDYVYVIDMVRKSYIIYSKRNIVYAG